MTKFELQRKFQDEKSELIGSLSVLKKGSDEYNLGIGYTHRRVYSNVVEVIKNKKILKQIENVLQDELDRLSSMTFNDWLIENGYDVECNDVTIDMTVEEVEEKIGHAVKIVKKKRW